MITFIIVTYPSMMIIKCYALIYVLWMQICAPFYPRIRKISIILYFFKNCLQVEHVRSVTSPLVFSSNCSHKDAFVLTKSSLAILVQCGRDILLVGTRFNWQATDTGYQIIWFIIVVTRLFFNSWLVIKVIRVVVCCKIMWLWTIHLDLTVQKL